MFKTSMGKRDLVLRGKWFKAVRRRSQSQAESHCFHPTLSLFLINQNRMAQSQTPGEAAEVTHVLSFTDWNLPPV